MIVNNIKIKRQIYDIFFFGYVDGYSLFVQFKIRIFVFHKTERISSAIILEYRVSLVSGLMEMLAKILSFFLFGMLVTLLLSIDIFHLALASMNLLVFLD
jgi:hypothetical protein